MSKFLATQAKEKVNGLTGKTTYEFGDLSRWLDGRAKERVLAIKGGENGGYKYEVGDFTRWADALAKEKAAQFSGKVTANEYELGDITKTIIPKIRSGEYNLEDIYLSLRVLAMAGFALLPIARFVPIQALIPLVNVGLAKDVGGRLTELLLTGLDARMKEALTGNANYQLGDIAKDRLRQELSLFTGKEIYAVGDLTRTIVERASARPKNQSGDLPDESSELGVAVASEEKTPLKISEELLRDLAQWDAAFLEQQGNPNPKQ